MKNYTLLYLLAFLTVFSACQSDTPVNVAPEVKAAVETVPPVVKEISNPKIESQTDVPVTEAEKIDEKLVEAEKEKTKAEIASEKRRAKRRAKRKKEAEEAKKRKEIDDYAKEQEARIAMAKKLTSLESNTPVELENIENTQSSAVLESSEELEEGPPVKTGPAGIMSFTARSYDFGRIEEGDRFEHEFKFFNSGDAPLVISDIKASCGCTKTTYPKEPIMPGEQGTIGVTFESKGKLGRQKPFMSVVTNGFPQIYSLYMEGIVETEKK